ncbi:MAG TPA: adenine deaminase [Candidatus Methanoperedens sp.]|nr:adenine deaminase [Candidatus Methanoperedens sp.]
MELAERIAAARRDRPADLLLKNARVVEVFSGEIEETDVALAGPWIVGLGPGYAARETLDLEGRLLAPGLIDAHVHIESARVPPREFARAVVPRGVTTVVIDPHEIANVLGLAGIHFMLRDAAAAPFDVFATAPSCVPASPLSTSGAAVDAVGLAQLRDEPGVIGLGEVMNYPGVIGGDAAVLAKIEVFAGRIVDGHAPGLGGARLNAYAAAGIRSDHECTTAAEAREKLRRGLWIYAREGSNARNLRALLPLVSPVTERRICLCTDDRELEDLVREGSVDHLVRAAAAAGLDPVTAIRLATLNTAERFGLADRGAVAPGRRADLITFSDLAAPRAELVFKDGTIVARDGEPLWPRAAPPEPPGGNTVRVDVERLDLAVPLRGRRIRAIGVVPGQVVTEHLVLEARADGDLAAADIARDLLKIAVIERHHGSGSAGLGFVRGLGLRRGAIAGTVAHDHHNLIVAGADDRSMLSAAQAVSAAGGGIAAADGERILACLPLPIAGLMSAEPLERVLAGDGALLEAARALGSGLHDPYVALSFLGLEVIPALKITDRGLVDVERFRLVPLFVEEEGP